MTTENDGIPQARNADEARLPVLALDLEGTLISNAVSQIARPGLFRFLTVCHALFARLVIYTTVPEPKFRAIAKLLVIEAQVPAWFADIEYVHWQGPTKDLNAIPGACAESVWLLDDHQPYVHPGQEARWLPIPQFAHPYPESDDGLAMAEQQIRQLAAVKRNAAGR